MPNQEKLPRAWVYARIPGDCAATRASFLTMIEQEPQVLQCFRVTGSYNFIIKVSCTDIDALEHLLTKMQKMGSTNTQIILNTQLDRGLAFDE